MLGESVLVPLTLATKFAIDSELKFISQIC